MTTSRVGNTQYLEATRYKNSPSCEAEVICIYFLAPKRVMYLQYGAFINALTILYRPFWHSYTLLIATILQVIISILELVCLGLEQQVLLYYIDLFGISASKQLNYFISHC